MSPDTCLCGSAGEDVDALTKLSDDKCTEGCDGSGQQACGKPNEAAAVYDGKKSGMMGNFRWSIVK